MRDIHPEYALRMNRVLDHIDRHLDQPLDLDTLADVAHFSRYHFHRVFASWVGETFGDYLRRRRLETAAWMLPGHPERSVLDIALTVGFGSAEAFARAFKGRFGRTPTEWRAGKLRNSGQADRNAGQACPRAAADNGHSIHFDEEKPLDIRIIDMPPVKVAYLRFIGPYGPPIGDFWRREVAPWLAANDLQRRPRYGIGYDNPEVTPPEKCRYDACVEVAADFEARGRFNVMTLPGGRYAARRFEGNPVEIGDAWMSIFRDWLPGSGFQVDARPCFEYYGTGFDEDVKNGRFSCDICIPVRPL